MSEQTNETDQNQSEHISRFVKVTDMPNSQKQQSEGKPKTVMGWAKILLGFLGSISGTIGGLYLFLSYQMPQMQADIDLKIKQIPLTIAQTVESQSKSLLNQSQISLNAINAEILQRQKELTELRVANATIDKNIKDNLARITEVQAKFSQSLNTLEERDKALNIDSKIMEVINYIQPIVKATILEIKEHNSKLTVRCSVENKGKFASHIKVKCIKIVKGATPSHFLHSQAQCIDMSNSKLCSSDIPPGLSFNISCEVQPIDKIKYQDSVGCFIEMEVVTNKDIAELASGMLRNYKNLNMTRLTTVYHTADTTEIVVTR